METRERDPRGPIPARFRGLPVAEIRGVRVPVARGLRARTLGLAWLDRHHAGPGLFIPRCASVHTFGMRFPLLVVFLAADGRELRRIDPLPPRRVAGCRGAAAVLELPAG